MMSASVHPRFAIGLVAAARFASMLVALLSLLVLSGYVFRSPEMTQLYSPFRAMAVLTVTALLFLSMAVFLQTTRWGRLCWPAAVVAGGCGLFALGSHIVLGGERLSPAIETALFAVEPAEASRMGLATAVCLLLLSASCWPGLDRQPDSPRGLRWSNLLAAVALTISGIALLGYAYGARDLYALSPLNAMALPTAASLFLLAIAGIVARPRHGWASIIASGLNGGASTRRQLLFTLLPPLLGWMLVEAMVSQNVGATTAMALLVALTVVPLALLVLRDGAVLDQLEAQRREIADVHLRLNGELERRLAEQATQLATQASERAEVEAALNRMHRLEAVGQLTGGIAHDFNNLLMAVKGNLELMKRRLDATHPARPALERAIVATAKGTKVTSQLLAFSRTQRLEIKAVELRPSLDSALNLVTQAVGPDIAVETDIQFADAWIAADPDQLDLAILNLAINARDAMPEGGALIIASAQRTELDDSEGQVQYIVISVTDNGHGMPSEVMAKAAEPFFTTKGQGKGTGLGLAQAYGFAKQCGGDLRIRSAPGEGTTVEIWLRRALPSSEVTKAAALESRHLAIRTVDKPVLVIDDDDGVRRVIVDALRSEGYTVIEASDGLAGLRYLEQESPSAVIIDFVMPGMNGAEVARLAQQRYPALPIIFVSGYSDTLALDGIAGAVLLRKPFELEHLHRAVAQATMQ
jgi:signal transduction histidine kinase